MALNEDIGDVRSVGNKFGRMILDLVVSVSNVSSAESARIAMYFNSLLQLQGGRFPASRMWAHECLLQFDAKQEDRVEPDVPNQDWR